MEKSKVMKKQQFTLIELLVVIAIIAVLATMLFPVVGSMKERSQQTKCTSNLSQLGKALLLYNNDHDGAYPFTTGQEIKSGSCTGDKIMKNLAWLRIRDDAKEAGIYVCPSSNRANKINEKDAKGVWTDYNSCITKWKKDYISYAYFMGEEDNSYRMEQASGIMSDGYVGSGTATSGKNAGSITWNHSENGRWLRCDTSVQSGSTESWTKSVNGCKEHNYGSFSME